MNETDTHANEEGEEDVKFDEDQGENEGGLDSDVI